MALSSVSYLGDGSNKLFSITFPYLSKSHVKVLVNGVEDTTFTWVTTGSINTTNTPVAGSIVVIKRETPTAPLVDFVDGSTLTEKLLDMSTAQSLFVAEESNDSITQLMQVDLNDNKFDGLSKAIKNVADPVNPQDVATKAWTEGAFNDAVTTVNTKASEASVSAGNALTSANNAASIYASFDDRMLGAKASDPLTDNDGNALVTGALYFNTSTSEMCVYSGSSWITAYVPSGAYAQLSGASFNGLVSLNDSSDIASASTVDLTTATGNTVHITGTTAIATFTMNAGQQMELIAVGALPLTYNATTMNINGGASYTCASGDRLRVFKDGAGVVRVNVTKQDGSAVVASGLPAGTIIHLASSSTPSGYLKANGALVSRTTYANLFAAIGTTFGVGDGSTTFALPDLRGEFLRGWDDGRTVDSGRVFGSAQSSQNLAHTHTVNAQGVGSSIIGGTGSIANFTAALTTSSSGGTESRPRNIALLACIKY